MQHKAGFKLKKIQKNMSRDIIHVHTLDKREKNPVCVDQKTYRKN